MTLTKGLTGRREAAKVTQATILSDEVKNKKAGKKTEDLRANINITVALESCLVVVLELQSTTKDAQDYKVL